MIFQTWMIMFHVSLQGIQTTYFDKNACVASNFVSAIYQTAHRQTKKFSEDPNESFYVGKKT